MRLDTNMRTLAQNVIKNDKLTTPAERLRFLGWLVELAPELFETERRQIAYDIGTVHNKLTAGRVDAGGWDFDMERKADNLLKGYLPTATEVLRFCGWLLALTPELPKDDARILTERLRITFLAAQNRKAVAVG